MEEIYSLQTLGQVLVSLFVICTCLFLISTVRSTLLFSWSLKIPLPQKSKQNLIHCDVRNNWKTLAQRRGWKYSCWLTVTSGTVEKPLLQRRGWDLSLLIDRDVRSPSHKGKWRDRQSNKFLPPSRVYIIGCGVTWTNPSYKGGVYIYKLIGCDVADNWNHPSRKGSFFLLFTFFVGSDWKYSFYCPDLLYNGHRVSTDSLLLVWKPAHLGGKNWNIGKQLGKFLWKFFRGWAFLTQYMKEIGYPLVEDLKSLCLLPCRGFRGLWY